MAISDRLLQKAVMQVESGGDPNAVSPKGARGTMQVMPATAAQPGFKIKPAGRNKDGSFKLSELERVGKEYLKAMRKRYPGNLDAALIAYNFGPGNADKFLRGEKKLPLETKNYIKKVRKELGQSAKQIERKPMNRRDQTRKTERTITGTPAENRAVQAGLRATTKALNEGKSRAEAQKIGADTTAKLDRDSRRTFEKRFGMLVASGIGGGGLAIAGRGLGVAGKALLKALRSQKGAGAKAKKLAQRKNKQSLNALNRAKNKTPPKVKKTPQKKVNKSQDAGQLEKAKRALNKTSSKVKKTSTTKKPPASKIKKTSQKKVNKSQNAATTGMSKVQKAMLFGTPLVAGGAYLATRDKKKETKAAPPTPKRKPKIQSYKPDMPTGTKPSNQSSSDPFDVKSKKDEAMSFGEMVKGAVGLRGKEGLEGKKRLVKTPFGNVTFDTSDSAFEEPEEYKAGGKVKRNVGGKVRGVGQAVKGFGKATYSNKLI